MSNRNHLYDCWLGFENLLNPPLKEEYMKYCKNIYIRGSNDIVLAAMNELKLAIKKIFNIEADIYRRRPEAPYVLVGRLEDVANKGHVLQSGLKAEGFCIENIAEDGNDAILIIGKDGNGVLYGVFDFIRSICCGKTIEAALKVDFPRNSLRIIDHWDNIDGKIERGYAGESILYRDNAIVKDKSRVRDYARLLASIGINGIVVNNVNVHKEETKFVTEDYLPEIRGLSNVFSEFGIKIYLSINFAAPIEVGNLPTADPLDPLVKKWWADTVETIYDYIEDFGGFLVKADSEFRPGPYTYGRNHADGANMLGEVLKPYGGVVIWRCFVYNCIVDWRDRSMDRAMASYDNFKPLDGKFMDNVILQVKNGPVDFQVREPVSPLFGAMEQTNMMVEFQITQEYTGQQKHLCYLVPMWKETLDFDTYAKGEGSFVSKVADGSLFNMRYSGIAGVANVGDSPCWTGHPLAQANLYGFGRLCWNPEMTSKEIADEWTLLTYGNQGEVVMTVTSMLLGSREIYENYTSPLGVGWMVNPGHHYGPNADGYEYSHWGTYHYADLKGIGVDRTSATGTGYTKQYREPAAGIYENIQDCPEKFLLFFHHVSYNHKLKSGKTVIQHIYDIHFKGVEQVKDLLTQWSSLKGKIDEDIYSLVLEKLRIQLRDAKEWRDVINTYFYRKTGIQDIYGRKIYK